MTGPEHYRKAESLLAAVNVDVSSELTPLFIEQAKVHATLALAAATAANDPDPTGRGQDTALMAEWAEVIYPTDD